MSAVEKTNVKNNSALVKTLSAQDIAFEAVQRSAGAAVGFSIWIRGLLQDWRQGTVGCKDRSEVNRTNKKPWKQKGTGRARAGTARSPLWKGGGVIFGPQPRVHSLKVNAQTRKNVLQAMLSEYLEAGKVLLLDWAPQGEKPKTSAAHAVLKQIGVLQEKVTLFVAPGDFITYASFANIPSVRILSFDQPNAYDLAQGGRWLVLSKDTDRFKEMVSRWI